MHDSVDTDSSWVRRAGLAVVVAVVAGTAIGCSSDGSTTAAEPVTLVCGTEDPLQHEYVVLDSIEVTQRLPAHMVLEKPEGEFELIALDAGGKTLDAVTFDFPPDPRRSGQGGGDITWDRSFCAALHADLPGLARVQVRTESRVDTDAAFTGDLTSEAQADFALQIRGVRVSGMYDDKSTFVVRTYGGDTKGDGDYTVSYRVAGSEQWVETPAEISRNERGGTAHVASDVLAQGFQLRVQVRSGDLEVAAESPLARAE